MFALLFEITYLVGTGRGGNLGLDLGKGGRRVDIGLLHLVLSEVSDLTSHECLLVLEEAVGAAEEAVERHNALEEAELGALIRLLLGLDCLMQRVANVGVQLGLLAALGERLLNHLGDLCYVSLRADGCTLSNDGKSRQLLHVSSHFSFN